MGRSLLGGVGGAFPCEWFRGICGFLGGTHPTGYEIGDRAEGFNLRQN